MGELNIQIDWPYALGIMGSLLVIAWYSGSRFSKIETSIAWLKDIIGQLKADFEDLKVGLDNRSVGAFYTDSPVQLTAKGRAILEKSGLKDYIDQHRDELLEQCQAKRSTNSYEVQEFIFVLFDQIQFDQVFDNQMKEYAYAQGITVDLIRRVGAIYFRDMCLKHFGMEAAAIDAHQTVNQDASPTDN